MANLNFPIETAILKSALVCASTEETRYYLRGVHIEPQMHELNIVSTDGHRLFCARIEPQREAHYGMPTEPFIIPSEAVKKALVGYKANYIYARREGDTWFLGDITFTPVDGTFPQWRRTFPTQQTLAENLGHVAQFNPAYMADLAKIGKALSLNRVPLMPHVHHCAENPAIVTFSGREDLFCLVMPMKSPDARSAAELDTMTALVAADVTPSETIAAE